MIHEKWKPLVMCPNMYSVWTHYEYEQIVYQNLSLPINTQVQEI